MCGRKLVYKGVAMVSKPLERGEVELHAPGVRRVSVRSRLYQLMEEEIDRYVQDNAEQLQYLIGRRYFDIERSSLQGRVGAIYTTRRTRRLSL